MMETKRRFEAVTEEGDRLTIVEFATFRWEKNAVGERCRVENDHLRFATDDGFEVVPTDEPGEFRVPRLSMTLRLVDDADTLRSLAALREPAARRDD
jgi:hypothetical protein